MIREALVRLAGVILLLLGIALLAVGFLAANKFMQATGFMGGVVGLILLYYTWAIGIESEPKDT